MRKRKPMTREDLVRILSGVDQEALIGAIIDLELLEKIDQLEETAKTEEINEFLAYIVSDELVDGYVADFFAAVIMPIMIEFIKTPPGGWLEKSYIDGQVTSFHENRPRYAELKQRVIDLTKKVEELAALPEPKPTPIPNQTRKKLELVLTKMYNVFSKEKPGGMRRDFYHGRRAGIAYSASMIGIVFKIPGNLTDFWRR